MTLLVLIVLIGVILTLGIGIVIAVVLALGARRSAQDVTDLPQDVQRFDSGRAGTKETP